MRPFLDFDSRPERRHVLVNNYDWMSQFSYLGIPARRRQAFSRECDAGQGFGQSAAGADRHRACRYTEFSYMLLQAYDFVYLHDHFGCQLQVGGSDQWGNITAGIDLARRHARPCSFTASPGRC